MACAHFELKPYPARYFLIKNDQIFTQFHSNNHVLIYIFLLQNFSAKS